MRVLDADPSARAGSAEVRVKVVAPVQPAPPEAVGGTPFRPVEFDGLTVTPYVDSQRCTGKNERCRSPQAYSLRASGMRAAKATAKPQAA